MKKVSKTIDVGSGTLTIEASDGPGSNAYITEGIDAVYELVVKELARRSGPDGLLKQSDAIGIVVSMISSITTSIFFSLYKVSPEQNASSLFLVLIEGIVSSVLHGVDHALDGGLSVEAREEVEGELESFKDTFKAVIH